jgi:hypothetical protein
MDEETEIKASPVEDDLTSEPTEGGAVEPVPIETGPTNIDKIKEKKEVVKDPRVVEDEPEFLHITDIIFREGNADITDEEVAAISEEPLLGVCEPADESKQEDRKKPIPGQFTKAKQT